MLTMEQRNMIFDTSVSDAALIKALKGVKVVAWDVIGSERVFKVKGGRSIYENAVFNDNRPGERVRFDRIVSQRGGLRVINRYVDQDTEIEFVDPATLGPGNKEPKRKRNR